MLSFYLKLKFNIRIFEVKSGCHKKSLKPKFLFGWILKKFFSAQFSERENFLDILFL